MLSDSLSQDLLVLSQNLKNCLIKQVFSYPHYLVLSLYSHGRKQSLYISRGKSAATILLDEEKIEAIPRIDDKYVHIFRSFLKGQFIHEVLVEEDQGMFALISEKGKCRSTLYMFYKTDGVYFLLKTSMTSYSKFFASWHGSIEEYQSSNDADLTFQMALDEFKKISGKPQKLSIKMSNVSYVDMWQKLLLRQSNRKDKKIELKKSKINTDITNLDHDIGKMEEDLKNEMEFGDVYKSAGHSVKFPRNVTKWKKREMVFNKLKALKKGRSIQEKRILALASSSDSAKSVPLVRPWNPIWCTTNKKKANSKTLVSDNDVMEYISDKNALVKIGKNENGNNFLLTNWSKANDVWVHLHDYPSAHAVIRFGDPRRDKLFDLIDEVAKVLRDLAGLNNERVSVVYTERRWVKPVKGEKGKVKLSKFHIYLPRM